MSLAEIRKNITDWRTGAVPWGEPIKGAVICILIDGIGAKDEL